MSKIVETQFRKVSKPTRAKKTVANLLTKLSEEIDYIVERYDEMQALYSRLNSAVRNKISIKLPETWEYLLDDGTTDSLRICSELMKKIDRPDFYDEDDEGEPVLKHDVIQKRLLVTLGSIPKPQNTEGVLESHEMLMHVTNVPGLRYLALEAASYELADTCKWSPPIATIMEVLRKHQALWNKRVSAHKSIQSLSKRITATVNDLAKQIGANKLEQLKLELKWKRDLLLKKQDEVAELATDIEFAVRYYERTAADLSRARADFAAMPVIDDDSLGVYRSAIEWAQRRVAAAH